MRRRLQFIVLATVLLVGALPMAAARAQGDEPATCARGVLIEGRCLSIDGRAATCDGADCIEFVEEVTLVCPDGFVSIGGDECERVTAAEQRPDGCPDGARGEVNDCHIFVAKGSDGCPAGSFEELSGNCKKPVANARGPYYCEDPAEQLDGLVCRLVAGLVPSACPTGTVRFDAACWRIGGLTPPETCEGLGLANTVLLSSGQCRVPELIFRGASGCVEGTELLQGTQWLEWETHTGARVGEGPQVIGCVERRNVGIGIATCLFNLERWGYSDGDVVDGVPQCTRTDAPEVAQCGPEYSIGDSLGGLCARLEPVASFDPPTCPEGWEPYWPNSEQCVEVVDFERFVCPAGLERRGDFPFCQEFRPLHTTWICTELGLLAPDGCWAFVGPQPDTCNALGTIDDCYSIQEPVSAACGGSGCIALGDFSIRGDVDCDGAVSIIDALLVAQYTALIREGVDTCADRVATAQLFVGDGDVNNDQLVDIIDALLVAQCDAGLPVLEGCG